jgi:hypothetical protein
MSRKAPSPVPFEGGSECRPEMHDLDDRLPPSIIVDGAASYSGKPPLPKGVELRVQVLDASRPPAAQIVAEQVVRSGWPVPIPFALRLPKEAALIGSAAWCWRGKPSSTSRNGYL